MDRIANKHASSNLHRLQNPSMTIDPTTEQRRQNYLDALYERSGRTCGTYTGLYQERLTKLVQRDMQELTERAAER
jgi:hypothetical protein